MPRAAHPDRSASASETIVQNDDHDSMNKTHNEHAMATVTTKRPLAHDEDDSLKKSTKKKRSFWSRLWSCFTPCLDEPEPHDIHVTRDPRNPAYAKRAEDDDKADSNKLTDETMVQTSPSRVGSNGAASATSAVPSPHLTIPATPVVITAPSTPTYNTFDLDPDPDVVIPPTPKGSHLLPVDETEGVTSGAVQPPGSTAHPEKTGEETDGGGYTDDEYHDAKEEEDLDAEEMRLIMNAGSGIPIVDGKPKPLLPPIAEKHQGRKCLVLDMDETLLHSSFKLMPQHDFTVPVEIEWQWHNAYVLKRPGVEEFLRRMGEIYEVVVYTASVSKYADPVLDKVDVHRAVSHRLFRESCYNHRGNYVKDLSMLGRPLNTCIILDNSPASYLFNPNNAVPVTTWFNDPLDTELTDLIGFLTDLATVDDVRPLLAREC